MDARRKAKDGGSEQLRRLGAHTPIMTVWRTDADPRRFDLSIDPSDRAYGTLWGRDPRSSNYGAVGFARNCTPSSALDLVGAELKCSAGEDGAVDWAAELAG